MVAIGFVGLAGLVAAIQTTGFDVVAADAIEINHVCDLDECRVTFEQVVLWDLIDGQYHVVHWVPLSKCSQVHRRGDYYAIQISPERASNRKIALAPAYLETWTLYDPEIADRELYPVENRRGLR